MRGMPADGSTLRDLRVHRNFVTRVLYLILCDVRFQILLFCAVAAAARVGIYLAWPGAVHPDETFQYIEQAHRLLGGPAIVPWEYLWGVRSWLLPGIVAVPLGIARFISDDPLFGVRFVSVACAMASVSSVVLGYRWGMLRSGMTAAIVAAALNATGIEMVLLGAHPLAEVLATPPLLGGLYLADAARLPGRRSYVAAGALLGLALVMRLQLAPAIVLAIVATGACDRAGRLLPLCLGAAVPVVLAGLLDWATWGWPFESLVLYFWVNWVEGVASLFGTEPWYRYADWLNQSWAPLTLPLCGLVLLGSWRAPLLGAVALTIIAALMAVGHKEYRFLYPAMPLLMTLAGIGAAEAAGWIARRFAARPPSRGVLGFAVAVPLMAAALALTGQALAGGELAGRAGTMPVMRQINDDPAACGLGVYPPSDFAATGGYSHLRRGIGLYGFDPDGDRRQTAAFNYMYDTAGTDHAAEGYQRLGCRDDPHGCLWRRPGACDPAPGRPLAVPDTPF